MEQLEVAERMVYFYKKMHGSEAEARFINQAILTQGKITGIL